MQKPECTIIDLQQFDLDGFCDGSRQAPFNSPTENFSCVKQLRSSTGRAPWNVLCDSESFLEAKLVRKYYQNKHIKLLHIPARCPDLNPIESFWGWLRARLRLRDLNDLRAGRLALGKTAYRARVRNVLKSQKAQDVAKAKFNAFKNVCKEVKQKRGAASRS